MLLSLAKAQAKLSELDDRWKTPRGEKLRRYLESRERALRVELIIRLPRRRRTELRVDMAALHKHCPELFRKTAAKRRGLSEELRELLFEAIDTRVGSVIEATVLPRLRELENKLDDAK